MKEDRKGRNGRIEGKERKLGNEEWKEGRRREGGKNGRRKKKKYDSRNSRP